MVKGLLFKMKSMILFFVKLRAKNIRTSIASVNQTIPYEDQIKTIAHI